MDNLAFIAILILIVLAVYSCEKLINGGKPELVFYHNPACPYCQPLYSEWDLLKAMDIKCLNLIDINNATDGGQFAAARGDLILETPTIVFYPFGKYMVHERYLGPRYAKDIYAWVMNRIKVMNLC